MPASSAVRKLDAEMFKDPKRKLVWEPTGGGAFADGRHGYTTGTSKMLVRNGYGVLLLDPRGQGESQGDLVRWAGDRDLIAAAEYVQARPDVDPGRVGGFGSSVGGEILLGAAAESTAFKAVVSEGAGLPAGEGGDVLKGGDRITVKRSQHKVRFLHPKGWTYFDTLRRKLHWNEGA